VACTPACAAPQVCYPNKKDAGGNIVGGCYPTRTINLQISSTITGGPLDNTFTGADVLIIIREVVQRLCERTQWSGTCLKYAESIEDLDNKLLSWVVTRGAAADQFTLTFPIDTGLGLKRQAATGDIQDLFTAAINDDFAPVGYSITYAANNGDTNPKIIVKPPNGASTLVCSTILLVLAIVLMM